jgi:hypothetical protein
MTEPAGDLILTNPFSLTEFKTTNIGIAALSAIEKHADDMIRAADAGDPPVELLIPYLNNLICEGLYWRMVDRIIDEWLGPQYRQAGKKPVSRSVYGRARCYRRVT